MLILPLLKERLTQQRIFLKQYLLHFLVLLIIAVLFHLFFLKQNIQYMDTRLRQYPLYSKTAPPEVLSAHFDADAFKKSQLYGKDKAKFALISGLYKQAVDSLILYFGFYAWSWSVAGIIINKLGYTSEYEVCSPQHHPTMFNISARSHNPLHLL